MLCNNIMLGLIMLGLAKYMGEPCSAVFFADEVFNPHELEHLPKHPCIVGKGASCLTCEEFSIIVDGVCVNTFRDPVVAVASWFAVYFIFNIVYPIEFACTLEFFQRCFVGINPICGSKIERKGGKKVYQGVHPKILKMLKNLDKFESWVKDPRC